MKKPYISILGANWQCLMRMNPQDLLNEGMKGNKPKLLDQEYLGNFAVL